jgi:nucleoside-diphosphate-sugar epimerase
MHIGQSGSQASRPAVLVTGGAGKLGRAVVRDLAGCGYRVVAADRVPSPRNAAGGRHVELELTDTGQLLSAMRGCELVIHLGAIRAPYNNPDQVVFANNTGATFAVLAAAETLGVRRVVVASSISILGDAFAAAPSTPQYAPVDEAHPLRAEDPYALSKAVDEMSCAMFWRRTGVPVALLRLAWVAELAEARDRAQELDGDPSSNTHMRSVLWSYVSVRDAAAACRHALEADTAGVRAYNITAADTLLNGLTADVIAAHAPAVEIRSAIDGHDTAWSLDRARRELGFEPRESWRNFETVTAQENGFQGRALPRELSSPWRKA